MGGLFSKTGDRSELSTNYANGKIVSFEKDDKVITAQINKFTCFIPSPGVCDLYKSSLSVIDDDGKLYKVNLVEATLIDKKITKNEAEKYSPKKKVFFYTYKNFAGEERVDTKEGTILSSNIIPSHDENFINDRSTLSIIGTNGAGLDIIPFTQPGLKLVEVKQINMKVKDAVEKYKIGKKVSYNYNGIAKDGKIISHVIKEGATYISEDDKVIIEVQDSGYKLTMEVLFTEPTLKLVEESGSGKQKYTLEEDSKYRVKYMKYKAKYLAQKN